MRQLLAHVLESYEALERVATQLSLHEEPEQDRVSWWIYDSKEVGRLVVEFAPHQAKALENSDAVRTFTSQARQAIVVAERRLSDDDPVCRAFLGTVRLSEYVATRNAEVLIHGMDLDDTLGLHPDPSAAALAIMLETLETLLGAKRPTAVDPIRFILLTTGRALLKDEERSALGTLAEKLPLFR